MTRSTWLATAALSISLATPAAAAPATVAGDPVLYWNEVLITALAGSPTVTSRGFAMVDVAIHDAANATLGSPNRGYLKGVSHMGGDTRAAVSVAARNVLVHLNPAKTADFDAALAASLALVPDSAAKTKGMATGAAFASAMIANRTGDGSAAMVTYTPSGLPGRWAPTPPGNVPASLPHWGAQKTWLIDAGNQFRPAAPPTLDSAAYTAAFDEVKAVGAVGSLLRTADQTASAQFWAGAAGTGPWVRAGIDAAQAAGLSTLENASLFARLSTSLVDAGIAVWDTKYTFDYWRPVTAIRLADLDGNDATVADPGWTPLITTPPHPSYVSAHASAAGAATTVLQSVFGAGGPFCVTFGGNNRCWSNFESAALDATNSRLWGGIHWSFDNLTGLAQGRQVAAFALGRGVFAAVPEPGSWAMMIAGFGLLGGLVRTRRRTLLPA